MSVCLQAPKDLSSVSLFVRITRGLHVVESTPVLSCANTLNDGSNGGGVDTSWSWRWEETLIVPGAAVTVSEEKEAHKGGGEDQEGEQCLPDPLVVAVHTSEEFQTSTSGRAIDAAKEAPPASEEVSMVEEVVSAGTTADGMQGDDVIAGDGGTVVEAEKRDSTDSDGSHRANARERDDQLAGRGGIVARVAPLEASGAVKKKRGVSFWSPRRARKTTDADAETTPVETHCSDIGGGSIDVESTTADLVVAATSDSPDGGGEIFVGSDAASDPGEGEDIAETDAGGMASASSASPREFELEVPVKVADTVVGEGTAEENGITERGKRASNFWGLVRGRRKKSTASGSGGTFVGQGSDVSSICDSEASTFFDINDPEEIEVSGTADLAPLEGSSTGSLSPRTQHGQGAGGSFWSPRREGRLGKTAGQAGSQKPDSFEPGGRACGNPCATATGSPHITGVVANESRASHGERGRRRRRAPLKKSSAPDALLVEVWEIKGSVAVEPCPAQGVQLPPVECGGHEERERSASRDLEETAGTRSHPLNAVEEASDRSGSSAETLPEALSDPKCPTTTVGDVGESAPVRGEDRHCDDASVSSSGRGREGGCVDDDQAQTARGDGLPPPEDGSSSVAPVDSPKNEPRRGTLFPSAFRRRRTKNKDSSKSPSDLGPQPVEVSRTEPPQGSWLAGADKNGDGPDFPVLAQDAGRQEEAAPLCETDEGEMREATLGSNASSVQEESGTDDADGDGDGDGGGDVEDASLAKGRPSKRTEGSFFSPFKTRKSNKNSPRWVGGCSTDKMKPALWGRMTIPVADALRTGTDRTSEDFGEILVDGQHVPGGVTDAANKTASDGLSGIPTTKIDMKDGSSPSMFGNIISRRGQRKQQQKKEVDLDKKTEVGSTVEEASGSRQCLTSTSVVERWFDIGHPNRRQGKRVKKGKVRLTLTWGGNPSPDNTQTRKAVFRAVHSGEGGDHEA